MAEAAVAEVTIIPVARGAASRIENVLDGQGAGEALGEQVGGGMTSRMRSVLLGTGAVVLGAAFAGLGATLAAGFSRLQGIDDARAKLTGLGHDAETVDAVMSNALDSVRGTAFGLDSAATVAASAVAAGVAPGEDLTRVLSLVADTATIAGGSMEELGAIFNKVAASNRLSMAEVNQLSDRGIPVLAALADQLGVTQGEVADLVSEGAVDFATFSAAMDGALGGAALSSANTFSGALANVGASVSRIGAGLLSGVFPSFVPLMQSLMTAMEPLEASAATLGQTLGTALTPAIEGLSAWLQTVDFTKVTSGLVGLVDLVLNGNFSGALRDAFGWEEDSGAVDFILDVRDGLTGLYELIVNGDFTGALYRAFGIEEDHPFVGFVLDARQAVSDFIAALGSGDLEAAGGAFTAALDGIGPHLPAIWNGVQQLGSALGEFAGQAGGLVAPALDLLTGALGFLADNMDTIVQFLPAIIAGFLLYNGAQQAAVLHSQALLAADIARTPVMLANNVMRLRSATLESRMAASTAASTAATGANTAATAANTGAGNAGLLTRIRATAAMVAQRVAMVAGTVASGAATAAQWALNAAMSANPIMLIVLAIAALVAGLIWFFTQTELGQEIWANFTRFLGEAWDNVVAFFITVGEGLAAWWNGLWAGIGAFFDGIWSGIADGSLFQGYVDWLMGIGQGVSDWWNGLWAGVGQFFSDVWTNATTGAKMLFEGYIAWLFGIGASITSWWNGLWSGIGSFFDGIWQGIVGWFESIPGTIKGAINQAIRAVNGAIGGINDVLSVGGDLFGVDIRIPTIPLLAKGGIVSGPTLAVIGEGRYQEAVVPLGPDFYAAIGSDGGEGGDSPLIGGDLVVPSTGDTTSDVQEILLALRALKRQGGRRR